MFHSLAHPPHEEIKERLEVASFERGLKHVQSPPL